ncbi:MAG: hypothetical protein COU25_04000 [Candidatus Levybacteria bacterium CG10_big_fil_rev_8_21_14_0_10_35_13]|nr:MAG: hypothetical protein COU25_04000 [Candidatus Levybacteria bacterium CG10_big_fil_rev_8_21_14_0_10_35_13]
MRIAINGYEAVLPRFGFDEKTKLPIRVGSSAYCFELLKNLNKIDRKNNYTVFLPTKPTSDLPKETQNWKYKIISKRKLWTITALIPHLLFGRREIDVFFNPGHYLPPFAPQKSVISILDVSYLYFPELFKKNDLVKLKNWTKYSLKKAKKILTISNSSRNDIIKEYGVDDKKVRVTYLAVDSNPNTKTLNMEDLKRKFGIDKDYILFVGTLQPRKNIAKLIEAFSKIRIDANNYSESTRIKSHSDGLGPKIRKNSDLQLVIVGKRGWKYEEILSAPEKFGVKNRVLFIHNASDEDLPSLYKNAVCFVLPSLYEGFGLPVLEAMKYGCPVLTSNVSSLPEAGGDAAVYFDPNSAEDIAQKVEKVISDQKLREEMVKKGYNQIKKFSWEKTARETLDALEEVVKNG